MLIFTVHSKFPLKALDEDRSLFLILILKFSLQLKNSAVPSEWKMRKSQPKHRFFPVP